MDDPAHFSISLEAGRSARAVRASAGDPARGVLEALELPVHSGVIVMHGGAQLDAELREAITQALVEGVAPLAEREQMVVADGGTYAGTMAAMGEARRRTGGTYPLVGVCPYDAVTYLGGPVPAEGRYALDPWHTHFVFVEGGAFGVESELLVGLAGANAAPGIALIVNGGDIVCKEAQMHAARGTPIVVVRGSGRMADRLADPHSDERHLLPPDARLEVVDLADPAGLAAALERLAAR